MPGLEMTRGVERGLGIGSGVEAGRLEWRWWRHGPASMLVTSTLTGAHAPDPLTGQSSSNSGTPTDRA